MKLEVIYNGDDDRMIVRNPDTGEELDGVVAVEFEYVADEWRGPLARAKITMVGVNVEALNPPHIDIEGSLPRKRRADGSIS